MSHKISEKGEDSSNASQFWESRWSVTNFLRDCDLFGQPIPAFNIKGKDQVKTAIGGILSAIIITVTLGYTIMKIPDLILKSNPIINENNN